LSSAAHLSAEKQSDTDEFPNAMKFWLILESSVERELWSIFINNFSSSVHAQTIHVQKPFLLQAVQISWACVAYLVHRWIITTLFIIWNIKPHTHADDYNSEDRRALSHKMPDTSCTWNSMTHMKYFCNDTKCERGGGQKIFSRWMWSTRNMSYRCDELLVPYEIHFSLVEK
jgi:hypothetical protein